MRKHMAIFAAASLAVAGISFTGLSHAQDAATGLGQTGQDQQQHQQHQPGHMEQTGQIGLDRVTGGQLPAGAIESQDEQAKDDIKQAVVEVTEAALAADDGFGNLLEHLSQADRERLQELEDADAEQLKEQISQLREAYQERYDQEFALEAEQVFTDEVQIAQGEVISPAILISWPVEPTQERDQMHRPGMQQPGMHQPGMQHDQDRQPGGLGTGLDQDRQQDQFGTQPGQTGIGQDRQQDQFGTQPGQTGIGQDRQQDQFGTQPGQTGIGQDRQPGQFELGQDRPDVGDRIAEREHGLEAGDQIAVVSFPESGELPAITISLVKEDEQWKLNLPDHVDAQTIEQNLTQGLKKVHERQEQWPEDAEKASAKLTHVVMMALYDVKADEGRDHMQPGQMHQPGQQDRQPGQLGTEPGQTGQQDRQPGQVGY
jgi:hypothetical protein